MVDVDLIPLKPLHTYYNNIFALQIYIHSWFYTDSKHTYICSPSKDLIHDYFYIQNLYSKIQCKKLQFNFMIFQYHRDSHQKFYMEINK
jgi:hypothetical protein